MKIQLSILAFALLPGPSIGNQLRRTKVRRTKERTNKKERTNVRDLLHMSHHRIVGGQQSDAGEFPYYVDLGGCGASLISPGVVLTAAHCGSFDGQSIIVGGYEYQELTGPFAQRVNVIAEAKHPNYDDATTENDFMLLKIDQSVTMNTNVVLSLNDQFSTPSPGQDLTVLGLGDTSEGGNEANFLRDVVVRAISGTDCNNADKYGGEVNDANMFCAGVNGGGKDSCQGDSGGPIVIRNGNSHVQVGVVSWGEGCAQANYPGVYARVSSAYQWIQGVVCGNNGFDPDAPFCSSGPSQPGPAPAPVPNPTPAPVPSPTPAPGGGNCSSGKMEFDFTITTDDWGDETSWEVRNGQGSKVLNGGNYNSDQSYKTKKCIVEGCHTMFIRDSFGDGLSEGGSNPGYVLKIDGSVEQEAGGIDFGSETSFTFGPGCGSNPNPSPTPAPVPFPTNPSPSCTPLKLGLTTDEYGMETSMQLLKNNVLVWDEYFFNDNQMYEFNTCLDPNECSILSVYDDFGDGILPPGKIVVTLDGDNIFNSGDFEGGIEFEYGNC